MMRITVIIAALIAAMLVPMADQAAAKGPPPPTQQQLDRTGETLEQRAGDQGIPGYATAVVTKTGTVYTKTGGDAGNGRPVTPMTPFVIGSVGKTFTSLAVMQLVEDGKLKLSDPVKLHLPEIQLAADPAADEITVGQLLGHTSGIAPLSGGSLMRSVGQGSLREAIAGIEDDALISQPGSKFNYANQNYVLAGLLIEQASGMSYDEYIEKNIFEPLDTKCSYTDLAPAKSAGLAQGHRYWFGFALGHGPTFATALKPDGYVISCLNDMANYLQTLLNDGRTPSGEQLISPESLDLMFKAGAPATMGPWADHHVSRYGLGWFVGGPWKEPALLHPGNSPDSTAMVALFPEREWGVVTLLNAGNEFEIPGNPSAMDLTSRNVNDALLGEPVKQGSLKRFYVVFDLIVLALLALAGFGLFRAIRDLRRGERLGGRRRAIGVATRLIGGALVLMVPLLLFGYSASWLWVPDFTLVVVLLGVCLIATGLLRLTGVLQQGG